MDSTFAPARPAAPPLRLALGDEPPPPLRLLQRWTPPSAGQRATAAATPAGPWWSRWWARQGGR